MDKGEKTPEAPLSYIRKNVSLPGENFVTQYGKLTAEDKEQIRDWAIEEMTALGIPVKV